MSRRRPRYQIAALPYRRGSDGALEVLLVTSRETRRWVIPKGWPMRGKTDWDAAATEAFEEAGLNGRIDPAPLGAFDYFKRHADRFELLDVAVYGLEVTGEAESFKEASQREARWFDPAEASELVQEPKLKTILLELPELLRLRRAA